MPISRVEFDPSPSAASRRLIGESKTRVSLTIYPPQAGSAYLSNDPMTGPNQGIAISAGGHPIYFHVDYQGDTVQREWYIVYTAGATGVGFIQGLK